MKTGLANILWFLSTSPVHWDGSKPNLSANCAGAMFDVCERLVPIPGFAVHNIQDSFSWRHEKQSYPAIRCEYG